MNGPRLVSYAHDADSITRLLHAGADHLIIDDPRLSIRSWAPPRQGDFSYLSELSDYARSLNPNVRLSLNLDGLYRDRQLPLITTAISAAAEAGLQAIRVMDAGLGPLIRRLAPRLALELATEMGNCSLPAIAVHQGEGFQHQVCSNDWPFEDLLALRDSHTISMEILVHGPVLLQYSDRRQLSAYTDPEGNPDTLPPTALQTVVIDGRPYPFADHQHGTMMYNTFDRCLYPYADKLCALDLAGWLIDGRGQHDDYALTALRAFAALRQRLQNGAAPLFAEGDWEQLRTSGERPFKPGFFLANNTDHCFDDVVQEQQAVDIIAEVIDVIRGDAMTLLVRQGFRASDEDLEFCTPEGRRCKLDLSKLCDHNGSPLQTAAADMVVRLPWVKGGIPSSTLQRPSLSVL